MIDMFYELEVLSRDAGWRTWGKPLGRSDAYSDLEKYRKKMPWRQFRVRPVPPVQTD